MKKIILFFLLFPFCAEAQIITTVAGNGTLGYSGDGGAASLAAMSETTGVVVDGSGNVYISDDLNFCIRKVNTTGIITTIAGSDMDGYSGDGGPATLAKLNYTQGIAIDNSGNLYIAELNEVVRKVNSFGIISTIAGGGTSGLGDGGLATAAELNGPSGITVDSSGNVYIADSDHNRIRKVNTAGIITTFAGNGIFGYSGDGGQADSAELGQPGGVTIDHNGNIYIADTWNNCIRKINSMGIISTIAGNDTIAGYSGDGGQATSAKLNFPTDVKVDVAGNIYIADNNNNVIRKISSSGIISTVAGNGYGAGVGIGAYSGDGGPATSAELYSPWGIALEGNGNLYIADSYNNRIRRVGPGMSDVTKLSIPQIVKIYPNPAVTELTISSSNSINQIIINNLLGQTLYTQDYNTEQVQVDVADLPAGMYLIRINSTEVRKFVKE